MWRGNADKAAGELKCSQYCPDVCPALEAFMGQEELPHWRGPELGLSLSTGFISNSSFHPFLSDVAFLYPNFLFSKRKVVTNSL